MTYIDSQVRETTRKETRMSWWAGKAFRTVFAVAAALVLILGVNLFGVACGGDDDAAPETAVQEFLAAMESQDIDAIIDLTTTPEDLAALQEQGITRDDLKFGAEAEMLGTYGALKFSDVTMETVQEGDEAVVTITGGSMTVEGMGLTLDLTQAQEAGFPTEFYLYKVDGKWYIDMEG